MPRSSVTRSRSGCRSSAWCSCAGSLSPEAIIHYQARDDHSWFLLTQPLAFLLFLVSVFAECNRLPFDLPESEQELVGGYHTEYSSLKLGMLLLAEYAHMVTVSFLLSVLFLGGWHLPGISELTDVTMYGTTGAALVKLAVLLVKMLGFITLFLLVRWTIPRFRFDQLMSLAWKVMIPLALLNLVCVSGGEAVRPADVDDDDCLGGAVRRGRGDRPVDRRHRNGPARKVAKLPPGLPPGVTYAGR